MVAYLNNPKAMKTVVRSSMKSIGSKKVAGKDKLSSRASELRSPSEIGSMLRTFGQSSREIIDDSSEEANIPQAITLMNDNSLSFRNSSLSKKLKSEKNMDKKIEMVFKAVLTRKPTMSEMGIMKKYTATGLKIEDIYWALINSHEFKLRM